MSPQSPATEQLRRENHDLTEHLAAAEAQLADTAVRLQSAQVQLEGLVVAQRIARVGHWVYDVATGKLTWSDEIYRIFGLAPLAIEPNDESFYAHVHPDDRALVWETSRRAISGEAPYDIEHRIVRPTGEVRIVREQAEVSRDAGGQPVRMLGVVHDITEQRRAEDERRQRADELQMFLALVESTPDCVCITDLHGGLCYTNPAFQKQFQYSGDDKHAHFQDFVAAETHAQSHSQALPELRDHHTAVADTRYQRRDAVVFLRGRAPACSSTIAKV